MKVLIDTDPGLGKKFADVDDGLALFFMLNNPEFFQIEGITTIFGNTQVRQGYKLLKKYLDLVGRENIPHFQGASSKDDFGHITEASEFLIENVKEHPKEITLLTLGPLTNIATAINLYPDFLNNLKMLVMMGGVLKPINPFSKNKNAIGEQFFSETEFNFQSDPIATKIVIEAKTVIPRILIGLDMCSKAVFKEEHLDKIQNCDNSISQYIAKNLEFWFNMWSYSDKNGFFPFDTFVPIYLMRPDLFTVINYFLTVNIKGKISIMGKPRQDTAPITYCTEFKNQNGEKEFMDILISNLIK